MSLALRSIPTGYRPMTDAEARALRYRAPVTLTDGYDLLTGTVAGVRPGILAVVLDLWHARITFGCFDPDLENGPAYPPHDLDGGMTLVVEGCVCGHEDCRRAGDADTCLACARVAA